MQIGEREDNAEVFQVKRYYVCYLDILGTREMLFNGLCPDKGQVSREKQAEINKICSEINELLNSLETLACGFREKPELIYDASAKMFEEKGYDVASILPKREDFVALAKKSRVGIQQFSDSSLFYIPIEPGMENIADEILSSWLVYFAGWMIKGMSGGFVFRGGISMGWGWEVRENCLNGPVVYEAYKLESEVAKYPRIVFSKSVSERLRSRVDTARRIGVKIEDVPSSFRLIFTDVDGVDMLDFFSAQAKRIWATHNGVSLSELEYLFSAVFKITFTKYDQFKESGNHLLAERYWRLIRYMNEKLFTEKNSEEGAAKENS